MEHICGVISGEKIVLTSLPDETGELGWLLPCEAFKSRPKLLGEHCDNVGGTGKSERITEELLKNSGYFKAARFLAYIWTESRSCCVDKCLGQWILKVTDKEGNFINKDSGILYNKIYTEFKSAEKLSAKKG